MATSGGQPGNDNAHKGGVYRRALKRALAELADKHGFAPDFEIGAKIVAARQVAAAVDDGDMQAAGQIADRLDGKPQQSFTGDITHRGIIDILSGIKGEHGSEPIDDSRATDNT